MNNQSLRIGAVAKDAGVNIQTLRYYERRGLLPRPARTTSGYRQYPGDTVQLVRFIKRAQELGFTLKEAQELLKLRAAPVRDRARVRRVAQQKVADIDAKLAHLAAVKSVLEELALCCESGDAPTCSIIDALNGDCAIPTGSTAAPR